MDRRRYLRSAAAAGAVALTGCTGGSGGGTTTTTSTTESGTTATDGKTTTTNGGTTTANGGISTTDGSSTDRATVTMKDTAFHPEQLTISPGTTVVWTNEDGYPHDVTAATLTDAGTDWTYSSGTVSGGGSVEHTFADAGAYEYYCTIHGKDTMCGVVLVGDQGYDATLPCATGSGY